MTFHFDPERRAEFYGGPWDGRFVDPTPDTPFPMWLQPMWQGVVYAYRAEITPEGKTQYRFMGPALTDGGTVT